MDMTSFLNEHFFPYLTAQIDHISINKCINYHFCERKLQLSTSTPINTTAL